MILNTQLYNIIKNFIIENVDRTLRRNPNSIDADLYIRHIPIPISVMHDILQRIYTDQPFTTEEVFYFEIPNDIISRYSRPSDVISSDERYTPEERYTPTSVNENIRYMSGRPTSISSMVYDTVNDWNIEFTRHIEKKDVKETEKKEKKVKAEKYKLIIGKAFNELLNTIGSLNSISDVLNHMTYNNGEWPIKTLDILDGEMVEYTEPKSDKKLQARIGRVIGRLMDHLNMRNDSHIEQFSNAYKAIYQINNNIINLEIVKGDDIIKYYHENNQVNRGPLGSSCMRHSECSKYIEFYKIDCVSLVVLKYGNKVAARALLWDMPNFKLMDRIYSSEDWQIFVFKKWASLNGYLCKHIQGHREKDCFEINSKVYTLPLFIELDKNENGLFPYLDTFSYTNDFKKFKTWEEPGDFKLCSTRGDYRIKVNGDYYDKNELVYSKYYNKWMFRNDAVEMPELGYVYNYDIVYINDEPHLKWNCWKDSRGMWRNDQYKIEDILAGTEPLLENTDTKKKVKKKSTDWGRFVSPDRPDRIEIDLRNQINPEDLEQFHITLNEALGQIPEPTIEDLENLF
jgi:hypothetical protein